MGRVGSHNAIFMLQTQTAQLLIKLQKPEVLLISKRLCSNKIQKSMSWLMDCNPKTFQKEVKRKWTVTWEPVTKLSILEGQGGQHCLIPFEAFFTECLHQGKYDTSPVIYEKWWQKKGEGERMTEKSVRQVSTSFHKRAICQYLNLMSQHAK